MRNHETGIKYTGDVNHESNENTWLVLPGNPPPAIRSDTRDVIVQGPPGLPEGVLIVYYGTAIRFGTAALSQIQLPTWSNL